MRLIRWSTPALGLLIVGSLAYAQDVPVVPPHPHKTYIDTKENKLYWPMDQPFFVRLAPSGDDNSQSFLLQRVTPESNITTEQYQNKGIGLEIEGKQFIRWFNYVTKQTVNLQFFTDGTPPETKANCTGAPIATVGGHVYYGKGLTCALTATDNLSGVEFTFLSVNGTPYTDYPGFLTLDKEKDVILRYYSVDHVGYAETPVVTRFTVDLTPPATTATITGNALDTILSTTAKFKLASTDELSGVAQVFARFDGQDYKGVPDLTVAVDKLADGEHTLNYYATDKVANKEEEHTLSFYLDRTPPTVGADVQGDQWTSPSGVRYVSARTRIAMTATDNKAGVAKIEYASSAGREGTLPLHYATYLTPFGLPTTPGAAKLNYRASDKLGNTSDLAVLPYVMDATAPVSKYRLVGPQYQLRQYFYITQATKVELTATDDASGVAKIESRTDDGQDVAVYGGQLNFAKEGKRVLTYWATDRVNNREFDKSVVLITDNSAPELFANFSLTPRGKTLAGLDEYRLPTLLYLGATDNASGVKRISYVVNSGRETEYTTPLHFDVEGGYEIDIRAEDNVGNVSTKHLKFVIRD